jgi:hypothetical protein
MNMEGPPDRRRCLPSASLDAFAPVGTPCEGTAPALNGDALGRNLAASLHPRATVVRFGIADMRGDGRPDYACNRWVLYADTVNPQRLPPVGPIVIRGMGFHPPRQCW